MPAKGPVSILWQIIFVVFVPVLDLWAFYRIKKLKKYFLYVIAPQLVIAGVIMGMMFGMILEEDGIEKLENFSEDLESNNLMFVVSSLAIELGFTIFAIYLIATWSEKWNRQFLDQ